MRSPYCLTALLLACAVLVVLAAAPGCGRGGGRRRNPFDLGRAEGGVVIADFQTLEDYLDHPTVQRILANMHWFDGNTPPDIAGTYFACGVIVATTIPGKHVGGGADSDFAFGIRAGDLIEVEILDPTIEERAPASFILGFGDFFTVFTAFRSVQDDPSGGLCEIVEVHIFSGEREDDGSLSDLHIGIGIVGLDGDCDSLLIHDVQISHLIARLVGAAGAEPPPEPSDPSKVLLTVENFLLNGILIFDDPSPEALSVLEVEAFGSGSVELDPGFAIDFESLRPPAGPKDDAPLMGEVVAGSFGQDLTPAGGTVTYFICNLVGEENVFYAPQPLNLRDFAIGATVNSGVPTLDLIPYERPFGSGLDCFCEMPPAPDPYDIGYYTYDSPNVIRPDQANVLFRRASNLAFVARITGPFDIDGGTGAVVLQVGP
jgi:hypothetical protein